MQKNLLAFLAFSLIFSMPLPALAKAAEPHWFPLEKVTRQPKGFARGSTAIRPTASSMQRNLPRTMPLSRKTAAAAVPAPEKIPAAKAPLAEVPKPLQAEHILAIFPP